MPQPRDFAIVSEPMAATESSTRAMAALDDLYRQHVGDVYRYTYAVLGNHADAEDVTQTTFVNALRALERGETPREPSHWLLAIAHNLVRQRWRQAANRPTMVELVHDVPDEAPGEDDVQLDELVRALQRIPPSQREALVMRELEGRSYNEIAELLGLTTAALETLLFRARRSLAEEIENLVTCQSAELALSKQSDGRLSRKERKRLDAHLAECTSCTAFAKTQARQRRAFKGLAVLPVPVGLALFHDVPAASAATVTHIGSASVSSTSGVGTAGTTAGGGAAGGTATVGGTVAGGSLLGGVAVKIAAVIAIATVAVGAGYKGVTAALGDGPSSSDVAAPAHRKADARTAVRGATVAAAGNPSASTKRAASESADNAAAAPRIATKGALPAGDEADHAGANGTPSAGGDAAAGSGGDATSGDDGATAGGGGASPGSGGAPGGSDDGVTAAAPGSGETSGAGGSSGSAGGASVAATPQTSGPSTTPKPKSAPGTKGKAKGKSTPKPKPKTGTPPKGGGGTKPTKPETPTAPGNGGAGGNGSANGGGSPNGGGDGNIAPKAPDTPAAAPPAATETSQPTPPTASGPASQPAAGESTATESGGTSGQKNGDGWGQGVGGGQDHKG
jgi:RNA polymerase sigma factor (sigma-70 family)